MIPSYQYRKSHYGDKTILRPSYLHNGISYTGKMNYRYIYNLMTLTGAENVALLRPATQSSTVTAYHANYAVDGDNSSFSLTYDEHPWWKVQLAEPLWVSQVEIINNVDTCMHILFAVTIVMLKSFSQCFKKGLLESFAVIFIDVFAPLFILCVCGITSIFQNYTPNLGVNLNYKHQSKACPENKFQMT